MSTTIQPRWPTCGAVQTGRNIRSMTSEFKERYNREWLIERHGYISPTAYRDQLALETAA